MEINILLSEEENLTNLINQSNGVNLRVMDVAFGKPVALEHVPEDSEDFVNTSVLVSASVTSRFRGSVNKTYRRIHLGAQWSKLNLPKVIQYLGDINDEAALMKRVNEYMEIRTGSVVATHSPVDGEEAWNVLIRPIQDSLLYIGQIEIKASRAEEAHEVIDNPVLQANAAVLNVLADGSVSVRPGGSVTQTMVIQFTEPLGDTRTITANRIEDNGETKWVLTGDTQSVSTAAGINPVSGLVSIPSVMLKNDTTVTVSSKGADERAPEVSSQIVVAKQVETYKPVIATRPELEQDDNQITIIPVEADRTLVIGYTDHRTGNKEVVNVAWRHNGENTVVLTGNGEQDVVTHDPTGIVIDKTKLRNNTKVTIITKTRDERDTPAISEVTISRDEYVPVKANTVPISDDHDSIQITPVGNVTKITVGYTEKGGEEVEKYFRKVGDNWLRDEITEGITIDNNVISVSKDILEADTTLTVTASTYNPRDTSTTSTFVVAKVETPYTPVTADAAKITDDKGNAIIEPGENNKALSIEYTSALDNSTKMRVDTQLVESWEITVGANGDVEVTPVSGKVILNAGLIADNTEVVVTASTGDERDIKTVSRGLITQPDATENPDDGQDDTPDTGGTDTGNTDTDTGNNDGTGEDNGGKDDTEDKGEETPPQDSGDTTDTTQPQTTTVTADQATVAKIETGGITITTGENNIEVLTSVAFKGKVVVNRTLTDKEITASIVARKQGSTWMLQTDNEAVGVRLNGNDGFDITYDKRNFVSDMTVTYVVLAKPRLGDREVAKNTLTEGQVVNQYVQVGEVASVMESTGNGTVDVILTDLNNAESITVSGIKDGQPKEVKLTANEQGLFDTSALNDESFVSPESVSISVGNEDFDPNTDVTVTVTPLNPLDKPVIKTVNMPAKAVVQPPVTAPVKADPVTIQVDGEDPNFIVVTKGNNNSKFVVKLFDRKNTRQTLTWNGASTDLGFRQITEYDNRGLNVVEAGLVTGDLLSQGKLRFSKELLSTTLLDISVESFVTDGENTTVEYTVENPSELTMSQKAQWSYDDTVLTGTVPVVSLTRLSGKVFVEGQETPVNVTYRFDNGQYTTENPAHLTDVNGIVVTTSGSGIQFKVGGYLLATSDSNAVFEQLTIETLDQSSANKVSTITDFNQAHWYAPANVVSAVNNFVKYPVDNGTLFLTGDTVNLTAHENNQEIKVKYILPNGNSVTETHRKSDGNWTAVTESIGTWSESEFTINGDLLKRPSLVEVTRSNRPANADERLYQVQEQSLELTVKPRAGEVEISEAAGKVYLRLSEPVDTIVITTPRGTETVNKPITAESSEWFESVSGELIELKAGTVNEEETISVIAKVNNGIDTSSSYTVPYKVKAIGVPELSLDEGLNVIVKPALNNVNFTVNYTSVTSGGMNQLFITRKVGETPAWVVTGQATANGIAIDSSTLVDLSQADTFKLLKDDVRDNSSVTVLVNSDRTEDGSQSATIEVGELTRIVPETTAVTLSNDDGSVKMKVKYETNNTKLLVNYTNRYESEDQIRLVLNDGTWEVVNGSSYGWITTEVTTEEEVRYLNVTFGSEGLKPNSTFTVISKGETDEVISKTATINTGERAYVPKRAGGANFSVEDGTLMIKPDMSNVRRLEVSYRDQDNELVTVKFEYHDDLGLWYEEGTLESGITFYASAGDYVGIPVVYMASGQTVNAITRTSDDRDIPEYISTMSPVYEGKVINLPTVDDLNAMLNIFPDPDTGGMTITIKREGNSPFESSGDLIIKTDQILNLKERTVTWTKELSGNTEGIEEDDIVIHENGATNIKQKLIADGTQLKVEVRPFDRRDTGNTLTQDLSVWTYPTPGEAIINMDDEKLKLIVTQNTADKVHRFNVNFTNTTGETVNFDMKRPKYYGTEAYRTYDVSSNTYVADVEGTIPTTTGVEISKDKLKLSTKTKPQYITVTSYGPNPSSPGVVSKFKVMEEEVEEVIENNTQPKEPLVSSQDKVITVKPADDKGVTRTLSIHFTNKDNTAERIAIIKNDGQWSYHTGEGRATGLNTETGELTLSELTLKDESVVTVMATNGRINDDMKYASANYTVVNPETPTIETDKLEEKPAMPGVNLVNEGISIVFPNQTDEHTKSLEIEYYTPNPKAGLDPIQVIMNVTRTTDGEAKWAIDEKPETVVFENATGSVSIPNSLIDIDYNTVRLTATNIKQETVRTFKPGMGKPTLTSTDGDLKVTIPNDNVTATVTVNYYTYGEPSEQTMISAYKTRSGWNIAQNNSGITVTPESVIQFPHHVIAELSTAAVMSYASDSGIFHGPFTGLITKNKPLAGKVTVGKSETELLFTPPSVETDLELTGYTVDFRDMDDHPQRVTVKYNREANTWSSETTLPGLTVQTNGNLSIPTVSVLSPSALTVSSFNTQNWPNPSTYQYSQDTDLREVVTITAARMESSRGNLIVAPTSRHVDKMVINFEVPNNIV